MSLMDSVEAAQDKLFNKIRLYLESYIFVLHAENIAILQSSNVNEHDNESIEASYLGLKKCLQNNMIKPSSYYRGILFIDLISSVELFFSELIRAVLIAYPMKIGTQSVEIKELIEGATLEEIIERSSDQIIYELMYESPEDYLKKMCSLISVDFDQLSESWLVYIEAKARRDLGVHNDWICNETYLRKTRRNTKIERPTIGQNLVPIDRDYCDSVVDSIHVISTKILQMMTEKYSK